MGFLPKVPVEVVVDAFAYFRMTCQEDWFETSASREMVPFGRL
jgi:AMMECR1 domain-containing protein